VRERLSAGRGEQLPSLPLQRHPFRALCAGPHCGISIVMEPPGGPAGAHSRGGLRSHHCVPLGRPSGHRPQPLAPQRRRPYARHRVPGPVPPRARCFPLLGVCARGSNQGRCQRRRVLLLLAASGTASRHSTQSAEAGAVAEAGRGAGGVVGMVGSVVRWSLWEAGMQAGCSAEAGLDVPGGLGAGR